MSVLTGAETGMQENLKEKPVMRDVHSTPFIASIVFFLCAIIGVAALASRGVPAVVATNLENLPRKVGAYVGTEDYFDEAVYQELNADRHVYRHYQSARGVILDLYIGYYGTAKGGRTPHNPYGCFPGSGWAIVKEEPVELQVGPPYDETVKVNYILSRKGMLYNSVLHWYQSEKTTILENGLAQNIHRFIGRILKNRNDGAFVRVSTLSSEKGLTKARRDLEDFAVRVLSLLPSYWPEERDGA